MLVRGNSLVTAFAVRNDSPITSLAQVKGKRVASEYSGNVIIKQVTSAYLASAGLSLGDVQPVPVSDFSAGLRALREGRVDAAFVGDPMTATTLELDAAVSIRALSFADTPPERIKEIPQKTLDELRKFVPAAVPAGRPRGDGMLKDDTTLVSYPLVLGASARLSDEAAYVVTRGIYEHYQELGQYHHWLKEWTPETMLDPSPPAPYHPGAVRFFKAIGRWNAQLDAAQQRLLGAGR